MNEILSEYAAQVILALVGLLVALVKVVFKDLENKAKTYLEAKTTKEQRETLSKIGREAFAFVEATYKDLKGEEKLSRAIIYASDKLSKRGIDVDYEELKAAILSAWLYDKRKAPPEIQVLEPVLYSDTLKAEQT